MLPLKHALEEWKLWPSVAKKKPDVIRKITTGLTNQNYLIECGDNRFILRINNAKSTLLGVNRDREHHIVKTLAKLKIAPNIVYSDPKKSYTLFEYIDGRTWSDKDFRSARQRQRLSKLIVSYQSLRFSDSAFLTRDYSEYFCGYLNNISRSRLSIFKPEQKRFNQFRLRLRVAELLHVRRALTHHDIIPSNIIETNTGLKILDWEYAAIGWPSIDVASLENQTRHHKNTSKHIAYEAQQWAEKIWWILRP